MRGYRMPYARRFNGDRLEASTSLELLSFDKASTQRDHKLTVSLFTYLSHLRTTSFYFILHDDRYFKSSSLVSDVCFFRLVAVLMASLYTSGLLAVAYMLIMISKFDKELEYCTSTKISITDAKCTHRFFMFVLNIMDKGVRYIYIAKIVIKR
uniref:CASP-like protein n=1 Tax=Elaeophora elaphi TaxID=1147741 RepID=A0A0R3RZI3_9BILA